MNVKLKGLNVQFRQTSAKINLDNRITFFHGQISTGKSTIARLIDYCLGAGLQSTPALNQELVNVQLNVQIEASDVLLEREGLKGINIRVTWRDEKGNGASVLAPTVAGEAPIWNDNIFNLSDLLFYLGGITPIKVRRSKRDSESKLVRLSFRDLMWYCYLEQDDLDSSFFRLEDDSRKYKSRDVMRFVMGFYTEQMNELELDLEKASDDRRAKETAAYQIRGFLDELGYGTEVEIGTQITSGKEELSVARANLGHLRVQHTVGTHFADELRQKLKRLAESLEQERQTLSDLKQRVFDQEQLKAELLTAKFKLSRAQAASTILAGVDFDRCPSCGTQTSELARGENDCILCGTHEGNEEHDRLRSETLNTDLDSRIEDLQTALKQHRKTITGQEHLVDTIVVEKAALDRRLADELETYDSAFLANAREAERRVAALEEKLSNLEKIARMPEALNRLAKEIAGLQIKEKTLRQQIQGERKKLKQADALVAELEDTYLGILVNVGVPGITPADTIQINRLSWIPTIFPPGENSEGYDFYSAGSGGKKTLLNVCYALAVHKVAVGHKLPLPSFLMIDSPMKNIGKEVNKETFLALYAQLYSLASGELSQTQFIIIDNEFAPPPKYISVTERYMPPPLIPGYVGA